MNQPIRYAIVSPVRNEAKHLPLTISSVVAQVVRPACWVIVNDGSSDETGRIADEAARVYNWIRVVHRADRGSRQAGGGVVDAFYDGYCFIEREQWDFLVKLDGDLSFGPEYFERCFKFFEKNDRLGIAGGTICRTIDGAVEVESRGDPPFHVRGATKIYRRECWQDIGGLLRSPGWDTMDEVKANMLGWVTGTIADLPVMHHRPTGAAYGAWEDRVKNGLGCYITCYHPLFMLLKSIKRMAEKPYIIGGLGFMFGFVKGYVTRVPHIDDKALIRYFQKQQLNRLFFRKSLWN